MSSKKHNPYCECGAEPSVHRHDKERLERKVSKRSGRGDAGRAGMPVEKPVSDGFWVAVRRESELRDEERRTRR